MNRAGRHDQHEPIAGARDAQRIPQELAHALASSAVTRRVERGRLRAKLAAPAANRGFYVARVAEWNDARRAGGGLEDEREIRCLGDPRACVAADARERDE